MLEDSTKVLNPDFSVTSDNYYARQEKIVIVDEIFWSDF